MSRMPSSESVAFYDKIVVGAGAAGCILAARLSEDASCRVLLVECGPDLGTLGQLPPEVRVGYPNYTNPPQFSPYVREEPAGAGPGKTVNFAWGRLVGGGSAINGQVFLRPLDSDFAAWVADGNTEWSFQRALPSMRRIERDLDYPDSNHGTDGPVPVARFFNDASPDPIHAVYESARSLGFAEAGDLNAPGATGVGATPFNADGAIRVSASVAYLDPARERENLTILSSSRVNRVNFDGTRAVGVAITRAGRDFDLFADEVILSAGAVGTAEILLRSGVGDANELRDIGIDVVAHLPGVGDGFIDHPLVRMYWGVEEQDVDASTPSSPLRVRYSSGMSDAADDMLLNVSVGHSNREVKSSIDRMEITALLMLPESAGSVKLRSSDPTQSSIIDFNYFATDADRRRMKEAVALSFDVARRASSATLAMDPIAPAGITSAPQSDFADWLIAERLESGLHVTSSCRMGSAEDPRSVVDQYGRVHGLDRLRVADASILPTSPRVNTNASAMLVGERVAEFITAAA